MQGFTEEHLSNAQFGRNKARFSIGARGNRNKSVTSHIKVTHDCKIVCITANVVEYSAVMKAKCSPYMTGTLQVNSKVFCLYRFFKCAFHNNRWCLHAFSASTQRKQDAQRNKAFCEDESSSSSLISAKSS